MRYAFIIGSNGPVEHEPLNYAFQDADNIKSIFSQAHCGFDVISPSPNSDSFEIDRQLSSIVASCNDEDTFICYFSGHGVLEKGQLFLLLDNTNVNNLFATALPVFKIMEALKHCKAESKLLILDCCHAGAVVNMLGLKSGTGVPVEEVTVKPDNHLILMASNRLEKARELKSLRGSFLTVNICSALSDKFNEADRDRDGKISIQDLKLWLEEKAKDHNKKSHKDQVPYPYLFGQSKGEFFLATGVSSLAINPNKEICPYQGLKPFSKRSSQFFFGRDIVVQALKNRLESSNFVLLAGASGSGKSSVVQAGLAPRLEADGWNILEPIVPWVEPVRDLKHAITYQVLKNPNEIASVYSSIDVNGLNAIDEYLPKDRRTLIIIDQFEEIFTVCSQEDERRRFIDLLTRSTQTQNSPLSIIATIRADFIESCLSYESLTRLIQNQTVWIPPLEEEDLKKTIISPAGLQDYSFEEGLPEVIIQQIGQEKNFLPLLQFTLTELWNQKDPKTRKLTLAHYIDLGGVLGALNRRAEDIFQAFQPREQVWAKRLFLKLVRTGMEAKDTRQRQPKQKILQMADQSPEDQKTLNSVLNKLVRERLIVIGKDIEGAAWVDLAHEALMEAWNRFAEWRKEDRTVRRLIDRIDDEQREWLHHGKNEKFLIGRGLLAQIQESWADLELYLNLETLGFYKLSQEFEQQKDGNLDSQRYQEEAQKYQLEAQLYREQVIAKDSQIELYRQQSQDLLEITKLMAARPITLEAKALSGRDDENQVVYNLTGANIGNFVASTVHGEQHNYSPDKSLAEAAAEIQQLLNQLAKTYPAIAETPSTEQTSELLRQEVSRNPTLKNRVLNALKSGGSEALQSVLSHPAASIFISAMDGWIESSDNDDDDDDDGTPPVMLTRQPDPKPMNDGAEIS
jgi:energy-coupling factor transporter ATP-binding protein EcfA2